MKLFHRDFGGEGHPPLVVLHGLLGSSRNWMATGRELAKDFHVLGPDLRNHGNSPHAPEHTYEEMVADVVNWLDGLGIGAVHLIGHSMGGKVAMRLACHFPERVRALVVVDISPRDKEPSHANEFRALRALPLDRIASRADADRMLAESVSSWPMRQFLLTNLVRGEEGGFAWQANLDVLATNLDGTGRSPIDEQDRYEGPALWIAGGKSDYLQPEDTPIIRKHFPRAEIVVFPESGHNPHVEDRSQFVEVAESFLRKATS